jgi:short-subunit dehydrogenase
MKKILIIGATSTIAQATARIFANAGDALFLVARNNDKLSAMTDDLLVRGALAVYSATLDVLDYNRHEPVINAAVEALEGLDLVLIAHGALPDQKRCEQSFELARKEFEVNALSTISLLTRLANYFVQRGQGIIAVISSVAGDRGRQSNYLYGSAKGAVTIFLQGLRNRLYRSGVNVITIKLGLVDTTMTKDFKKNALWAKPPQIAKDIAVSLQKGKMVVYLPHFWRWIIFLLRSVPEGWFRRTRL